MRIALCLSGQLRFVEQGFYDSIRPNILDTGNVDVFIHTWNISPEQIGKPFINGGGHPMGEPVKESIVEDTRVLYNPTKMVVEPQIQFESGKWTDRTTWYRSEYMLSMFYSIYASNELKKSYEKEHNFKYDWVVRSRFDVTTPSGKLQIQELDSSNLYTPADVFDPINGYVDSLAYSNSKNMDIYSDTYNNVYSIMEDLNMKLVGEYVLRKHVDNHNINVIGIGTHKLYR